MEKHKFTGKTREEAIQQAVENLQELEENLIILDGEEQKGGLFKSKKVEIIAIEKREVTKYIKEFLIELLKKLGFKANVEVKTKEGTPNYTIYSDNDSLLIGKNGKNLNALSLIVKENLQKEITKKKTVNLRKLAKVSAKSAVSFKKANKAGGKRIAVNAKSGKVTLKKGLKKGTYNVKVKLTAAENATHQAAPAKTITLKLTVKR